MTPAKVLTDKSVHKTVKCKLDKFLPDPDKLDKIRDAVERGNIILRHTCQFLKLYLLYRFQDSDFPAVDTNLIVLITKVVANDKNSREGNYKPENLATLNELKAFYDENYKHLQDPEEVVSCKYLLQMMKYASKTIMTAINNNIIAQFRKRLYQLINVGLKITKKSPSEDKKKAALIKRLVFNPCEKVSADLSDDVSFYCKMYLPKKEFDKNNVDYDLRSHTIDFLPYLFRIHLDLQRLTGKTFAVVPLKTSMVYGHVTFDGTLVNKLFGSKSEVAKAFDADFNSHCVRKPRDYDFNGTFTTDGVVAGLLYYRSDTEKVTYSSKPVKKGKVKLDDYGNEVGQKPYLGQVDPAGLYDKHIVTIDPNKDDIIYANNGTQTFRYTLNQRQVESKAKRYRQLMLKDKKTVYPIDEISEISVNEMEADISFHNSKSPYIEEFTDYISAKNLHARNLSYHYNHGDLNYRQLRFNSYNNLRRSEDNMVNRFNRKFGEPRDTVIIFGDSGTTNIKYKAPVKNKGMRKLFERHGYQVILIDEFRTSKLCSHCHCPLHNALSRPSPRPWRDGVLVNVHGLKRCKTENCQTYANRDKNATENMLTITYDWIDGYGRPEVFTREYKFDS